MPAYVSDIAYMPLTCEQLAASDAQRKARSNDTVGVILLGLPVSSLSGSNQASQIARLKGELEALQRAAIKKDCGLELVTPAEMVAPTMGEAEEELSGPRAVARDPRRAGR